MQKIKEITADIKSVNLIARIEKVATLTGASGQNYMIVHLVDSTGRMEARKWTVNEADKQNIQPNNFIELIDAATSEYRGQLQVKINSYQILDKDELIKKNIDIKEFVVVAPIDVEKDFIELMNILNALENEVYKNITMALIKKYENSFKYYPAAMTIHHNVESGLFWHSYTLVKNALAIKPLYKYANVDWELLICGSILHDIGKISELTDENGSDYSLEGKLLGHISIGNAEIAQIAEQLDYTNSAKGVTNKFVTLLQHMVLASHGKNEFGSPTEPVIIEAIILSTFDNLDARIYRVNEEVNKVDLDSWTGRLPSEDGKMFLKHKK
ncbi:3'-5' exoribonuclease YhaM family protein [Williamsoniiplasma lucivorax]|uniref:3'-5' exoribonuclease n=1 Tax=Williamsoniiplasma lucivorax TaxID=209274 RepID=A0A2S5RDP0_9MOLU|nr:HD domain-containing protein [Williamsoniiplasma lucivorax]PPE05430.1 3'-5' exoribonuclease [Williamsoniiplasma lucivorax]